MNSIFILIGFLAFSSAVFAGADESTAGMVFLGNFQPTFYWVALEKNNNEPKTEILKDRKGHALARVSADFFSEIRMEGTGKLLDGRVLNFASVVSLPGGGHEVRYLVCPPDAPYGYGVNGYKLVPFRSIAVDTRVIPIGSIIYMPAAKGVILSSGEIHDGYFLAVDVGDMINDQHIDIFTGYGNQAEFFYRNNVQESGRYPIYLVRKGAYSQ